MGLGRWSVVGSSMMWHGDGSGCGHSVVVGSGILGQSLHGGGMVGVGLQCGLIWVVGLAEGADLGCGFGEVGF